MHFLLQAGRTVHATVRDPIKSSSVQHLLDSAKHSAGTLKLFKVDLLTEGRFDEAMQGCALVMHTASPFVLEGFTDAEAALVKPAVLLLFMATMLMYKACLIHTLMKAYGIPPAA